jgi:hypothetical protein
MLGLAVGSRVLVGALLLATSSTGCAPIRGLPDPDAPRAPADAEARLVEAQPLCIGSRVKSVGRLADSLYYTHAWLSNDELVVGYYAFYSDERPWGNNWLTWLVLPAAAIDLVYTRSLFIGPGYNQLARGKGDVEGFRVHYRVLPDGSLRIDHAVADDTAHRERRLEPADLYAVDPERPTLYASSWSHHLAARGARDKSDLASLQCFGPGSIRPLSAQLVREFHLDRRARPAAVAPPAPAPRWLATRRPSVVASTPASVTE